MLLSTLHGRHAVPHFLIHLNVVKILDSCPSFRMLPTARKWTLYFCYIIVSKPVHFPFYVSVRSIMKEGLARRLFLTIPVSLKLMHMKFLRMLMYSQLNILRATVEDESFCSLVLCGFLGRWDEGGLSRASQK